MPNDIKNKIKRTPRSFGDLRGWINSLKKEKEICEIEAEVDWDVEIGNIIRMGQGTGYGPAFLFKNIKDYNKPDSISRQIFSGGQGSYSRIAMMFGLPRETPVRELVKTCRTIFNEKIKPITVKTGPVKENILKGDKIDLLKFPVPKWNRGDGGRYILSYAGCVTKDPETDIHNIGIYRGMVINKDKISVLLWRAQGRGNHYAKHLQTGAKMPVAFVIGWEPSMGFTGGAPIPRDTSEYDVMGSIRGKPVELVDCETVPLQVPANAEIVIEGWISTDPTSFEPEGPYAEFTGYYAPDKTPKHVAEVTCISHRDNPIFRGAIEGAIPGSYSENPVMSSIQRSATAWNALESAGVPGVVDVFGMPIQACVNTVVSINQTYRGQAKQVAAALWGNSASHVRYKHVTVVDSDINIHDYDAVDWAMAWRFNAGEGDLVVYPDNWGAGLDPSVRARDSNVHLFGTGKWHRVLFDCTINLDYEPDSEGRRYPPTIHPEGEDAEKIRNKWAQLGLSEWGDPTI